MDWQEEHQRNVASFPEDIRKAHSHCSNHRNELLASAKCGCFYCCAIFPQFEIGNWIDEDSTGVGQTALCPKCGIDSVIGDKCGYDLSNKFLKRMHDYWF